MCFNEIYVKYIGKDFVIVEVVLECDNFMLLEEVKEFGLIDEIVENCFVGDEE